MDSNGPLTSPARRTPSGVSAPAPTMRRDMIAAYIAAGTRIAAWAVVSAIVYRLAGAGEFGTLALIRGTIGILTYTAVGLAPTLIRLFAEARHRSMVADGSANGLARE